MCVSRATPLMDGKYLHLPTSFSPHPLTRKLLIISNLCILKWIDLASQIYIIFPFGVLWLSLIMATACIIYCEVVIVTVTKTANRPVSSSWPCQCPTFQRCAWLLKTRHCCITIFLSLKYWNGFLSASWFLCYTTVAWSSNDLEQKSQQFFQRTARVIIWQLDYRSHKNPSRSLSRTHWSEAYPNAATNPFNRDTERQTENVRFPTLLFHRIAQKMNSPWVVACNQVHVLCWP